LLFDLGLVVSVGVLVLDVEVTVVNPGVTISIALFESVDVYGVAFKDVVTVELLGSVVVVRSAGTDEMDESVLLVVLLSLLIVPVLGVLTIELLVVEMPEFCIKVPDDVAVSEPCEMVVSVPICDEGTALSEFKVGFALEATKKMMMIVVVNSHYMQQSSFAFQSKKILTRRRCIRSSYRRALLRNSFNDVMGCSSCRSSEIYDRDVVQIHCRLC